MKNLFLSVSMVVVGLVASAQNQGVFKFERDYNDFGVVEEGQQATHTFEFTNTGNAPIVISNVAPSCGCTTPDWTRDPIAPGAKGKITASYNSAGRPGAFNKSINVQSNASEPYKTLYIRGTVLKKSEMVYTEEQKKESPKIVVEKVAHNFGRLEKGQKAVLKLKVSNAGKNPLVVQGLLNGCNCMTYTISKPEIKTNESAVLEITYVPAGMNEVTDLGVLQSNDITNSQVNIKLQATVVESLADKSILNVNKPTVTFK